MEMAKANTGTGTGQELGPSSRLSAFVLPLVRYSSSAHLHDRTALSGSDGREKCVRFNFDSDPRIFLTLSISLIDNGLISDLFFI